MNSGRALVGDKGKAMQLLHPFHRTLLGLGVCAVLAGPMAAAPASVPQTKTHDVALYPVNKSGQVPAHMRAQMDLHLYPGVPSFRTFLGEEFKDTAEGFLARYLEMLRSPKADVEKAIRLYEKREYQTPTGRDEVRRQVEMEQRNARASHDIRFHSCYDVGLYSLIVGEYVDEKGETIPLATYFLHKTANGYRFSADQADAVDLFYLVSGYFYNYGVEEKWNKAPRVELKVSMRVPSPFAQDPPDVHPFILKFNGTPSRTPLDDRWAPTDEVGKFFQRVVQTARTGTQQQWAALWIPEDQEWWSRPDLGIVNSMNEQREKLKSPQAQLVFTMDLGPNAVVFYIPGPNVSQVKGEPPRIEFFVIWRGKGEYQLTQGGDLPTGEETFVGNINTFFTRPAFQNGLRKIIEDAFPSAKTSKP